MTKIPSYWKRAKRFLSKKDKTMLKLIKNYSGPSETTLTTRRDIFFSLCKSIIGQQISVAAANAVFLRFKAKCSNKINANNVLKLNTSQLKQIGRWSAEMILLFTYNRSNIWPIQDIGLLRAISKNYKKDYLPPIKFVNLLQKRFSPYCSVATWYLWRSIDPEPIQY